MPRRRRSSSKLRLSSLNAFERARAHQMYAAISAAQQNPQKAREHFQAALAENALPPDEQASVRYQIAQLYLGEQKWSEAIENLKQWFAVVEEKPAAGYYLLALAYYQLGDFKQALGPAEQAVSLTDNPQEAWLQILLAIRLTLASNADDDKERARLYKEAEPVMLELVRALPEEDLLDADLDALRRAGGLRQGAGLPRAREAPGHARPGRGPAPHRAADARARSALPGGAGARGGLREGPAPRGRRLLRAAEHRVDPGARLRPRARAAAQGGRALDRRQALDPPRAGPPPARGVEGGRGGPAPRPRQGRPREPRRRAGADGHRALQRRARRRRAALVRRARASMPRPGTRRRRGSSTSSSRRRPHWPPEGDRHVEFELRGGAARRVRRARAVGGARARAGARRQGPGAGGTGGGDAGGPAGPPLVERPRRRRVALAQRRAAQADGPDLREGPAGRHRRARPARRRRGARPTSRRCARATSTGRASGSPNGPRRRGRSCGPPASSASRSSRC